MKNIRLATVKEASMGWMKISFEGEDRVSAYRAFRGAFTQLWIRHSDDDRVAVYVSQMIGNDWPETVVAYLSPLAAEIALAGMDFVRLSPCARPSIDDVARSVGSQMANDPSWADLPEEMREEKRRDYRAALMAESPFDRIEILETFELRG